MSLKHDNRINLWYSFPILCTSSMSHAPFEVSPWISLDKGVDRTNSANGMGRCVGRGGRGVARNISPCPVKYCRGILYLGGKAHCHKSHQHQWQVLHTSPWWVWCLS